MKRAQSFRLLEEELYGARSLAEGVLSALLLLLPTAALTIWRLGQEIGILFWVEKEAQHHDAP